MPKFSKPSPRKAPSAIKSSSNNNILSPKAVFPSNQTRPVSRSSQSSPSTTTARRETPNKFMKRETPIKEMKRETPLKEAQAAEHNTVQITSTQNAQQAQGKENEETPKKGPNPLHPRNKNIKYTNTNPNSYETTRPPTSGAVVAKLRSEEASQVTTESDPNTSNPSSTSDQNAKEIRMFVGGLPALISQQEIIKLFSPFAPVSKVSIATESLFIVLLVCFCW